MKPVIEPGGIQVPVRWLPSSNVKVLFGLLLLLPSLWWLMDHLVVISTRSINHYLLWKSPLTPLQSGRLAMLYVWSDRSLQRLMLTPQEQKWLAKIQGKWLIKRLAFIGPQKLTTISAPQQPTRYACNDQFISQAIRYQEHHFFFNGQLPLDYAFVIGDHPDSLDSRYLGLVDISQAQRVLTWRELFFGEQND